MPTDYKLSVRVCLCEWVRAVRERECMSECVRAWEREGGSAWVSEYLKVWKGGCNKLCNFSVLAVAFKIKLVLRYPAPTNFSFLFPPLSGTAREFRKEAWVLFSIPLPPHHCWAFWNLSTMPCQCGSRVQLALCKGFFSLCDLPEAGRALPFF